MKYKIKKYLKKYLISMKYTIQEYPTLKNIFLFILTLFPNIKQRLRNIDVTTDFSYTNKIYKKTQLSLYAMDIYNKLSESIDLKENK